MRRSLPLALRAVVKFVWESLSPVVRSWQGAATILTSTGVGGLIGGLSLAALGFGALAGVILLLAWNGGHLQNERDERAREGVALSLAVTREEGMFFVAKSEAYEDLTNLWVLVENLGPSAHFSARIRGPGLDFDSLAWNESTHRRRQIDPGGQERLRIASVAREPFAMWFWAAKQPTHPRARHGIGPRVPHLGDSVSFTLEVVNGSTSVVYRADCTVTFEGERVTDFDLTMRS